MEYTSVEEKANEWNVTVRQVQKLCKEGRIEGAKKQSATWLIPKDSVNPCNKNETLRVLSLFSGCGGMDLGFEGNFVIHKSFYNPKISKWDVIEESAHYIRLPKTRFKTVFANDIRPDARTAWVRYFEQRGTDSKTYHLDSIVDLVKLEKDNDISIFPKNIDVVTGGFPCQDFSVAGKREGFDSQVTHRGKKQDVNEPTEESRGTLYMWMREVISITQPKVFFAENVKGLVSLSDVKKIIEADFASIGGNGYLVLPARVLWAANFGVPQNRERVIFIGLKKSELKKSALKELSKDVISKDYDPYPEITHSNEPSDLLLPFSTLKDAFQDLCEPNISKDIDQQRYSKAKYMGKHCQGQSEINLSGIGPTIRSEHHGNIEYRRLSEANGGKYLDELSAGKEERRLTIRECARIQTFPDDYKFIQKGSENLKNVSASDAYKIIGNAVPPLLAFHLAMRIQSLWNKYFK